MIDRCEMLVRYEMPRTLWLEAEHERLVREVLAAQRRGVSLLRTLWQRLAAWGNRPASVSYEAAALRRDPIQLYH